MTVDSRMSAARPTSGVFGDPSLGQMVCDGDYRIVDIDESLAQMLGYTVESLIGRRAIDLVVSADRMRMMAAANRVRRRSESMATDACAFHRRTGDALPAYVVLTPRYSHRRGGMVCAVLAADHPNSSSADLAAARVTALASADVLRLLNIVTAAANATMTLPAAAAPAISSLCTHFGWHAGALVEWSGDGGVRVRASQGDTDWISELPTAPAPTLDPVIAGSPARPILIVPMADTAAFAFTGAVTPAEVPFDVLRVVAAACARVDERERALQRAHDHVPREVAAHAPRPDVDSLTGLANRSRLLEELDAAVEGGSHFAVLLVDLDEFKSINDTHGHDIGDEALVQVAERLRDSVRPDDLVVRFGGDEFVILCQMASAATVIAQRIVTLLEPPMTTAAGPISITASVGISDASIPVRAPSELLTRADAAMYRAKRLGKNRFVRYDDELHAQVAGDRRIETLLRRAVADGRLMVHYQPIVGTAVAGVVGVEAVARLLDDDGEVRLPSDFLTVAERSGLIAAIDAWVLRESCRCIGEIRRLLGRPISLSVNVSAHLLARSDLVETIRDSLSAADLPPAALMVELTESTLMNADAAVLQRLASLLDAGVRVALDNYGSGYSPLGFLGRLPLSHVKVDRHCITGILGDGREAALIEAITWVVNRLGMSWIAEGVETEAQWQAVRQFGPGLAQGYFFARPLAQDELVRTLRADAAAPSADSGHHFLLPS